MIARTVAMRSAHKSSYARLVQYLLDPQNKRERRALERVTRQQGECQRLVDGANDFLSFSR